LIIICRERTDCDLWQNLTSASLFGDGQFYQALPVEHSWYSYIACSWLCL